MGDIRVTFVGKELRSPICMALHAVLNEGLEGKEKEINQLKNYAELGVGFIHTPFICPEEEHPKDAPPEWKFQSVRLREAFMMEGLVACCYISAPYYVPLKCRLKHDREFERELTGGCGGNCQHDWPGG